MAIRKIVGLDQAQVVVAPPPEWYLDHEPDWDLPGLEEQYVAPLLDDSQWDVESGAGCFRTINRLLNHTAVAKLSQATLGFDPASHRLVIHEVAVWRKEKGQWSKRSFAQMDRVHMLRRATDLEMQIIDGYANALILLEDVRIDDAVELHWMLEPLASSKLKFNTFAQIAWGKRMGHWHFSVRECRPNSLRWKTLGIDREPEVQDFKDGCRKISWFRRRPGLHQIEPNTPQRAVLVPVLFISEWETWKEAASAMCDVIEEAYEGEHTEIDRCLQRWKDEYPNSIEDRALAAIRFVQDEVRYLAVDMGVDGGITPSSMTQVFRQRFGDCKDKAFLLSHLLNRLGITAAPALVATDWKQCFEHTLPHLGVFNHAIVCYHWQGQKCYIDATKAMQGGDLASQASLTFGEALVLTKETETLSTIEAPRWDEEDLQVSERMHVYSRGVSRLRVVMVARRGGADRLRATLFLHGKRTFLDQQRDFYSQIYPGLMGYHDLFGVDDDRKANQLKLEMEFDFDSTKYPTHEQTLVLEWRPLVLFSQLGQLLGEEPRKSPWQLTYPVSLRYEYAVHTEKPLQLSPEISRLKIIKNQWFQMTRVAKRQGEASVFELSWRHLVDHVKAEACKAYREQLFRGLDLVVMQLRIIRSKPGPERTIISRDHPQYAKRNEANSFIELKRPDFWEKEKWVAPPPVPQMKIARTEKPLVPVSKDVPIGLPLELDSVDSSSSEMASTVEVERPIEKLEEERPTEKNHTINDEQPVIVLEPASPEEIATLVASTKMAPRDSVDDAATRPELPPRPKAMEQLNNSRSIPQPVPPSGNEQGVEATVDKSAAARQERQIPGPTELNKRQTVVEKRSEARSVKKAAPLASVPPPLPSPPPKVYAKIRTDEETDLPVDNNRRRRSKPRKPCLVIAVILLSSLILGVIAIGILGYYINKSQDSMLVEAKEAAAQDDWVTVSKNTTLLAENTMAKPETMDLLFESLRRTGNWKLFQEFLNRKDIRERTSEAILRLADADLLRYRGRFEEAISTLTVPPEVSLSNQELRVISLQQADICLALGTPASIDRASKEYAKVLALFPNDIEAATGMAELVALNGRSDAVPAVFSSRIEKNPEVPENSIAFARYWLFAGKPAEAMVLADQVLRQFPKNESYIEQLLPVYMHAEKWDRAVALANQLLKTQPYSPIARLTLAHTAAYRKDFSATLEHLDQIIKTSPGWPPAIAYRAKALLLLGRKSDALVQINKCLEFVSHDWLQNIIASEIFQGCDQKAQADEAKQRAKVIRDDIVPRFLRDIGPASSPLTPKRGD